MAFGTMTSRVLGQIRESLLAAFFDKRITDAWAAAFRIPNMFRRLLGEGSLSVSFIPVFVDARLDHHSRAQNLVNTVYTYLLVLLGCLTAFGVLNPQPLLNLVLDPIYQADIEKYNLTLRLTKIMFGFIFFVSSFAFMMGILNALGQFALPAMAPTFWNLAMIISILLPKNWFPFNGDQLAWGVLVGGAVQAIVLLPALKKSGYWPSISFDYRNPDFQKVIRNMGPGLVGMGLLQFTTIVNLRFASSLVEGTISYINYVDRLIELPLSIISVSLGTALLPVLAGHLNRKDHKAFLNSLRENLEINLLMTTCAAAVLYVLAEPFVQLVFGHGRFNRPDNIITTAGILKTYCWIMIFTSGVRVLTPAYYAAKNTWYPAFVSALALGLHLILAPILLQKYQVHGLMFSTICSAALNLFLLSLFFSRFVAAGFELKEFVISFFKTVIIAMIIAAAASGFYLFRPYFQDGFLGLLIACVIIVSVSVIIFIVCCRVLGVSKIDGILKRLQSKVLKR